MVSPRQWAAVGDLVCRTGTGFASRPLLLLPQPTSAQRLAVGTELVGGLLGNATSPPTTTTRKQQEPASPSLTPARSALHGAVLSGQVCGLPNCSLSAITDYSRNCHL